MSTTSQNLYGQPQPASTTPSTKESAAPLNYCPNCGEKIEKGAKFCEICGTELEK